jgi:acyl carrier protein
MISVHDAVVEILVARFDLDAGAVVPEATLDDLGLDSLSQLELATVLKKRLGAVISDEELDEVSTVADVVALVEKKGAVVK